MYLLILCQKVFLAGKINKKALKYKEGPSFYCNIYVLSTDSKQNSHNHFFLPFFFKIGVEEASNSKLSAYNVWKTL